MKPLFEGIKKVEAQAKPSGPGRMVGKQGLSMNRILLELDETGYITAIFIMSDDDRGAAACVGRLAQLVGNRTWGWLRRIIRRKR